MDQQTLAAGIVFVAAVGAGIVGGIFYGFSSLVMAALARVPVATGVEVTIAMIRTVVTPSFMIVFLGSGLLCLVAGAGSLYSWNRPGANLILAASLIYLAGSIGVTMLFNEPLNQQLTRVGPGLVDEFWRRYLEQWTWWNHVRTAASIPSTVLFIFALRQR